MPKGLVVGILQARMSSTRLPGKVLKPILGRPMLSFQIERLLRCNAIDKLVIATSIELEDAPIEQMCKSIGVSCYRGSLDDVLDRFYQCAQGAGADHVLRLTGDCPLADPAIIADLVTFYFDRKVDYASNCRPPSLPDGIEAEIFSFDALKEAWFEARDPYAREHVVPFIVRQPGRFTAANWKNNKDLSGMRWTVDHPEDYEFVRAIYENLYPIKPDFALKDILDLLTANQKLVEINAMYSRKPGCETSPMQVTN